MEGYVWAENIGWIKFNGAAQDATAYKVNTSSPTAIIRNNKEGFNPKMPQVDSEKQYDFPQLFFGIRLTRKHDHLHHSR